MAKRVEIGSRRSARFGRVSLPNEPMLCWSPPMPTVFLRKNQPSGGSERNPGRPNRRQANRSPAKGVIPLVRCAGRVPEGYVYFDSRCFGCTNQGICTPQASRLSLPNTADPSGLAPVVRPWHRELVKRRRDLSRNAAPLSPGHRAGQGRARFSWLLRTPAEMASLLSRLLALVSLALVPARVGGLAGCRE